ncbi:nucleoside-triphosphate pyrophosphatase [Babesia microti strain RI]|uniref:XTP/dITP diphosphatase n=1 Tax=Babesia microti (strain RI) TaxID=1133968 RepID=A0A1N6LXC4_BABMR|nr:nucleoside-triphosphate pyrophosphatase [Babesia microti strain RI]SIO73528.1 nucleoside-triphosphate pyrophosphatase [Babesia microti strain RI]|eukprot:XP_021337620.1 nucleoside-triphosphate pyrophosphatase [Babesia microti strain RI]
MELTFCSSNKNKYLELSKCFAHLATINWAQLDIPEIQGSLDEIVTYKADYAYKTLNKPVLVEDTALGFTALNGLPGQYIKTFVSKLSLSDITKLLDGFPDKTAVATTTIGFHDGTRVHTFSGSLKGKIVQPRGQFSFGWDPIFVPEFSKSTFAEMTHEEKVRDSHRTRAINAFKQYIYGMN